MFKKKAIIIAVLLAILCAGALHRAAATTHSASEGSGAISHFGETPQFSQISSDGVQFLRHSHEPAACTASLDGKASMTSAAELCLCDGAQRQWKAINTGAPCTW